MTTEIKVIIAEDEAPLRAAFVKQLSLVWPQAVIAAECADGIAALAAVQQHQPQVAFLDIKMPRLNGLEVAQKMGDQAFVVFTTAYDQYAIAAFESGAVDYLLKPIATERLIDTVERLKNRLASQQPPDLTALMHELQAKMDHRQAPLQWITASSGNTTKMIAIDDVLYFKSEQKHTKVVTQDDAAIIRTTLKELLERVDPDQFWQVHRSAIVAVKAIDAIKKNEFGTHSLRLRNHPDTLPVSKEFQRRLKAL